MSDVEGVSSTRFTGLNVIQDALKTLESRLVKRNYFFSNLQLFRQRKQELTELDLVVCNTRSK